MGVFSEIAMEQQNGMFDSSAAFEDDEAFELEEMESLPVPPVGTDTVPVSAASVCAGETALADAEEEPADEVAPAGEEKSAEEGNSAQPPAAEDEEKKRAEHEVAEAQRKAEFDAKQQAKKAAEQEQIARLEAMSDEEVIAASTQRVSTDVEKLTRRNMKECVSEHIQMLCIEGFFLGGKPLVIGLPILFLITAVLMWMQDVTFMEFIQVFPLLGLAAYIVLVLMVISGIYRAASRRICRDIIVEVLKDENV